MGSNLSIGSQLGRLRYRAAAVGLGVMLLLGATGAGAVRDLSADIPDQLGEIRALLSSMEAQLVEMQTGVDENASGLSALGTSFDEQMDLMDLSNDDVFESVNSVEVTTKLCFDSAASMGIKLGGMGEFGASWTKVLHVEAAFELDEFWNLDMGMGTEICIDVPLYSVYWPELEVSQSEGALLHPMMDGFSLIGRANLPIVGVVTEQVLPPPESVRGVLEAVELAFTSGDPADARKLFSPSTYTPMTPPLVSTMINTAAVLVLDVVIDPCGSIESSPLFSGIPVSTYDWMCFMDPNATMTILQTIANVVDLIVFW